VTANGGLSYLRAPVQNILEVSCVRL